MTMYYYQFSTTPSTHSAWKPCEILTQAWQIWVRTVAVLSLPSMAQNLFLVQIIKLRWVSPIRIKAISPLLPPPQPPVWGHCVDYGLTLISALRLSIDRRCADPWAEELAIWIRTLSTAKVSKQRKVGIQRTWDRKETMSKMRVSPVDTVSLATLAATVWD